MPERKKSVDGKILVEKSYFRKLQDELIGIREEVKKDITGPVIASFGFIIALIWRDAIQSAIGKFLQAAGLTEQAYIYNFISAIIVTIIVIALMISVVKFGQKKVEEKIEEKVS
jgi:hypothetical protein